MSYKLNVIVNCESGDEIHDIPGEIEKMDDLPKEIDRILTEQAVSDIAWSSLVVVIVNK